MERTQHIMMLQALHGDAFILNCTKGANEGIIVVDGGPHQDSFKIIKTLEGLKQIDLLVVTHYDDDHIGGILDYIRKHKDDKPFPIKEMWVNCAYQIPYKDNANISMTQAKNLADELTIINKSLNLSGFPTIKWETSIIAGQKFDFPFADIFVLSPLQNIKDINDQNYRNDISNISRNMRRQEKVLKIPLRILSENKKEPPSEKNKKEVINWASIAFLLSCNNFNILMLGDSYPCTIIKSLNKLGYNINNKLIVDYVKVSHHGSYKNICNNLLDIIQCKNFLISTNGGNGRSCHPDRETIANIVCHKERNFLEPIQVYLNYELKKVETRGYKFINNGEEKEYNFSIIDNIQSFPYNNENDTN